MSADDKYAEGQPGEIPAVSDDGNATLLLNKHQTRLRYCADRGRWLVWDEKRWAWQQADDGEARELAKRTLRQLKPTDNEIRVHKKKSLSAGGITATLIQARTDPRASVLLEDLDAHINEINTPSGIINLKTGDVRAHDPYRLHTKITGTEYNPDQAAPGWEAFLNTTFGSDPHMIAYIQQVIGYAATGRSDANILPFFHGKGKNGKTVLVEVIMAVLGDYAGPAPRSLLLAGPAAHETEMADLQGQRFVVAGEPNETDQFDEAKTKLLTGGDRIKARYMHKDHFKFDPTHALVVMGNYQPKVTSGGDSFWRRLRLIPFTHQMPEDKQTDGLAKILVTEEGPAILAWIVKGAIEHNRKEGKFDTPEAVLAATTEYAEEEDAFGQFLSDCCTEGDAAIFMVRTAVLHNAYEKWCAENGSKDILSTTAIGRRMKVQGYGLKKTGGHRVYTGIMLTSSQDETAAGNWMDVS